MMQVRWVVSEANSKSLSLSTIWSWGFGENSNMGLFVGPQQLTESSASFVSVRAGSGVLSVAVCTFSVSDGSTCERNGDAVAAALDLSHSSVALTDVPVSVLTTACGA